MAVNEAFAEAVLEELERGARARRSSSTTTTSTSRRGSCASAAPDATARALRPHPVAAAGLLARAAATRSARAIHDGLLANDVVGFHTQPLAARTSCAPRSDLVGAEARLRARAASTTTSGARSSPSHPISVDPHEFDELASSDGRARRRARPRREAGPRSWSCASTGPTRRRTSSAASAPSSSTSTRTRRCTAASACSRCSTRRARTSPSTPSTSARSSVRRARVNDRFQRDGWTPIELAIEDNFPRLGRGVQAVRRAARERDLRRDEPRREGGAARERARRRAHPVRERRRPRGARRLGADDQPVRRLRPGGGDPRGARDAGERAARADRRDPRPRARARPRPRGSTRSWPTSTAGLIAAARRSRAAVVARREQRTSSRSVNPATLEPVGAVPTVRRPRRSPRRSSRRGSPRERWARVLVRGTARACSARSRRGCSTRADELAATVTAETGKPLVEAYTAELFVALDNLMWAAANAPRVLAPERLRSRAAAPAAQARPAAATSRSARSR